MPRDRVLLGRASEIEILLVDPHQWLAGANVLSDIDETLDHLAWNAESQVALNTGRNDAGEGPRRVAIWLGDGDAYKRRCVPRIALDLWLRTEADRRGGPHTEHCGHGGGGKNHCPACHGVSPLCSSQSKGLADAAIDRAGGHEAAQPAQEARLKADRPSHAVGFLDRAQYFGSDRLGARCVLDLSADGRCGCLHAFCIVVDRLPGLGPVGAELRVGDVWFDRHHADAKAAHFVVK